MDSEQSTLFNKIDNYLEEEEDKKDTDFDEWFKSYVNESHNNQKTDEPKPSDDMNQLNQSKDSEDDMKHKNSEGKSEGKSEDKDEGKHQNDSESKSEGELHEVHQHDSEDKDKNKPHDISHDDSEVKPQVKPQNKSKVKPQNKSKVKSQNKSKVKPQNKSKDKPQVKHQNESQNKSKENNENSTEYVEEIQNENEDETQKLQKHESENETEDKHQDKDEDETVCKHEVKSHDKDKDETEGKLENESREKDEYESQEKPEVKHENETEDESQEINEPNESNEDTIQKEIPNVHKETIVNTQVNNENVQNEYKHNQIIHENGHDNQNNQNVHNNHNETHRPGRRKIRVKKEKVGQVKNFPNGSIEIGDGANSKQPTDKEIIENIEKSKNKLINDINEQVKEMELNGNCKHIDPNTYNTNAKLFNVFYQYIIGKLFVPRNCVLTLDINEYINNTTVFKYNAFDAPNTSMQHPIPEKIIFLTKLNNIFNFQFVNSASGDFHFNDLDKQVTTFLYKYKDYGTTRLEYGIIKSLMGKLIIALNTSCELALRDNTKPRLSTEFKQAIIRDIECMKYIQSPDGKLYTSWKTFLNSLLSIGSDNLIYVHDNYPSLNTKLKTAYDNDFLTENLLANMLKCYLPSVAINYFYVIKSVYIVSRLLSIYIQEKLYITTSKKKSFEEIVNDIYAIATVGAIMYENKSYIFKQMTRTLPRYDKEITENTKMYILNHLLTGGQYYILKMFEESLPVVASLLV